MADVAGLPFFRVEFRKDGTLFDRAQAQAVLDAAPGFTDLIVFSHGWNNDLAEAQSLYDRFFAHFRTVSGIRPAMLQGRRLGVLGVFWPSKKFDERDLIPGGGAAAAGGAGAAQEAALAEYLARLKGAFDDAEADAKLDEAIRLVALLDLDPAARDRFADLLRSLHDGAGEDEPRDEPLAERYARAQGSDLIEGLANAAVEGGDGGGGDGGGAAGGLEMDPGDAGDGGGAAGLGALFQGVVGGARLLANLTTFYQMKDRAGKTGRDGLGPLLAEIHAAAPKLRLHLAGHSFGARLVTAAAAAGNAALPIQSMTLLQGAFSHDGFAADHDGLPAGFFRGVVTGRRIAGPVVVTHTRNDKAVGLAYAIASRVARQTAAALGDANDPYGGLGSNGAQHTPEADALTLLDAGGGYAFRPCRFHNLKSDKLISGHSDVATPATAWALLNAIAT